MEFLPNNNLFLLGSNELLPSRIFLLPGKNLLLLDSRQ